jgi:hypothetical protein
MLEVPNRNFEAEAGTGIDTRIKVMMHESSADPVYLSTYTPLGISAFIQPDTLLHSDSVVLSVFVTDTSLAGEKLPVSIHATDHITSEQQDIHLNVIPGSNAYVDDKLAKAYRDSALKYLYVQYPGMASEYGHMLDYEWSGFYPYPPLDIVSHYVFISGNWRMNVLWHVMVPPDDWKKIFIYNGAEKVCWGIKMDTDDICTEISCEKMYYFNQDTVHITKVPEIEVPSLQSFNYPNPFSDKTTISFPNPLNEPYTFNLYDSQGRLMKKYTFIRDHEFYIERVNLTPGIYYYQITGKRVFQGKMIIQ